MPRAIWSGSISFGLVNIPVKLYSAVSRKTVHFNQVDRRSGSRVKQKRVDAETGDEVPWEEIVKGYELPGGGYVTVTDDELAALDPKAVRTIEIEEFVDQSAIDPVLYDAAYLLVPDKVTKPYALLARAMEAEGKVGIAHLVMRTKQYLAAIRPQDGRLVLSTMVYADELNDPASIPELAEVGDVEVSDRELAMATQLVESLSTDFEPDRFQDTYREAVLELIERKAAGEDVIAPVADAEPDRVVDLMAALEASVAAAKQTRARHPTAHPDPADDADASRSGAAEAPAEKRQSA
ncbi:MAG: Ku protein [Acidimicrobiales bacterium]|jgi:DNA end-binding protein Ku|nr:Ku protein [Acidimicrobiales bacterium]